MIKCSTIFHHFPTYESKFKLIKNTLDIHSLDTNSDHYTNSQLFQVVVMCKLGLKVFHP